MYHVKIGFILSPAFVFSDLLVIMLPLESCAATGVVLVLGFMNKTADKIE
mgnify:CR=1 FL=1